MSGAPDSGLFSVGMLLLLGAFHGINPGMGWLFAVALAMQDNRRTTVWRALLPLGIGHAAAIAVVVLPYWLRLLSRGSYSRWWASDCCERRGSILI